MSVTAEQTLSISHQTAWDRLSSLSGQDFFQNWIELQCSMIVGTHAGVLAVRSEADSTFQPVALWPESFEDIDAISELIEQVIAQGHGLITEFQVASTKADRNYGVAYPVNDSKGLYAVAALAVTVKHDEQLQNAMRLLQWGCAWVELSRLREQNFSQRSSQKRLSMGVEIIAKVLAETDYSSASMLFVTELAMAFKCDRVSLGIVRHNAVRVEQLSNTAQFGKKMNVVRAIEDAMDESVDQRETLRYLPDSDESDGSVTIAHAALSKLSGDVAIMTVPLYVDTECIGAVTFERYTRYPFTQQDAEYAESIASLTIVALEEKRLNNRVLPIKIYDSLRTQLARLLGAGYLGRKLLVILLVSIVSFFSWATDEYRLSADAVLDTSLQRVIAAPFDGYVRSAAYRAGDVVEKEAVLVSLDDKDLHLERLKWLSQRAQLNNQYQEVIAQHDRAQINVINARLDQAKAQLNLVEADLERSQLKAPFDGLIVSGDLSQRLGGSVVQGEQLFEISPLNAYRVNLAVKESRIVDVQVGQTGTLYLSALPANPFNFEVTKITPVAEAKDGATYFRVEAALKGERDGLRPGMEGVGKIYVDDRKLIVIWSRELMEWLRLQFWSWWG